MAADEVRIDKWLWAMRLFKTRNIAADACKKGRISIKGNVVKPSRTITVGTVVEVKKPPITYSFKALQLTENRLGAKLVPEYMENVTSPEQFEVLERMRMVGFIDRDRGTGRPTKKERRDLDAFMDFQFDDEEWDF